MKYSLVLLFLILFFSCSSDDVKGNPELVGEWGLIAQLLDPGDGSGTFETVNSSRVIEFFANGSVVVNGELCFMNSEVGPQSSGTYSESGDDAFYDGIIVPNDCDFSETRVYYEIEGDNLILWYQCIEGCGQKFKKK